MKHTIRKIALAAGIALAFAGAGTTLAADAKPKSEMSQEIGDARREAQIWTSYAVNRHLRALDLKVEVKGDKAILNGTVESGVEKDLAEQIALGVDGIKHVDNNIVVDANFVAPKRVATDRTFGEKVEDATITASVKSKLLWNSHTDGLDIHVDTQNGQVTLTGTANTGAEKDLAGQLARNTNGVVGLNNQIALGTGKADKPKEVAQNAKESTKQAARETKAEVKEVAHEAKRDMSDSWITAKVKSTLLFTSNVDGLDINVETKNGVVSLSGDVDSASERDRAVQLAQNIRGVKRVDPSGIKVR